VRAAQNDWESVARFVVGAFRAGAAAQVRPLVDEPCQLSPEFAAMTRDNDARTGVKHIRHPVLGPIAFEYSAFAVGGRPDLAWWCIIPRRRPMRTGSARRSLRRPRAVNSPKARGSTMQNVLTAILAFGVELAVLWACWTWGFHLPVSLPMRSAIGLCLVVAVAAIWGALLAPRARRRLPILPRAIAKIAIFAGAAMLAWNAQAAVLAGTIALLGAISLIVEYVVKAPDTTSRPQT
jgi:hypothetical protein